MKIISQYKDLPRRVYILCGARTVTAMGMFIFSFASLILTTILGYSTLVASYVLMSSSILGIIGAFVFGHMADISGRKIILQLMLLLGTLNLFISGLICYTPYIIITLLLSNFIFSGVLPIVAAMVTDWSEPGNRAQCFSLLYLCVNLGFSIGQIFAGMLFYDHYPWIFWAQGIAWLLTAIIVGFFIKDDYVPVKRKVKTAADPNLDATLISMVLKDKILIGLILALMMLTFVHMQVSFMVPLQFNKLIGLKATSLMVSHLWLINGISCVVLTPVLTLLIKKIGILESILLAALIYVVSFGLYGLFDSRLLVLMIVPLWTSAEIIVNTTGGVFIASRSPEAFRARYQSLSGFAGSAGNCIAPLVMGLFLVNHTYMQGWMLTSSVSGVAAILLIILVIASKRTENQL